ncbi:MAG: hypothetical protein EAY69_07480 [Cytophagales bacterium]|nr:MAG: hypothetical protein EAY69_07480 [Cytophagales bacterium]
MHYFFIILLWLFSIDFLSAQDNKKVIYNIDSPINGKTVSFTEFLSAIEKGNELVPKDNKLYEYVIRDVKVRFIKEIDKGEGGMDKRFMSNAKPIVIKVNLRLSEIDFDPEFWFVPYRLHFEGHIWWTKISHWQGYFVECIFKKSFAVFNSEIEFLDFVKCKFENGYRQHRSNTNDHIKFDNCIIDIQKNLVDGITQNNLGVETRPIILDNKVQNIDFTLQNCKILVNDSLRNKEQFFVHFKSSIFSNLRIINTEIQTSINLENATISNNFQLYETKLKGQILILGINMNPLGARLEWEIIKGKLGISDTKNNIIYNYGTRKNMPNAVFNELFSAYAIVYTGFKSQGNRYSTNQCYIEWKNLETEYLRQLLAKDNQNTVIYFTYLMNVFLDVFCDYGTNPLKSLYMSVYVLLIFTMIYFFMPHNFGYQKKNFYSSLRLFLDYLHYSPALFRLLRTQKTKVNHLRNKHNLYWKTLQKRKVPFFFYWVAIPDYILQYFQRRKIAAWFSISKVILQFTQSKNSYYRRFGKIILFFLVCLLVFENLFLRLMDCLALSINLFTTLGFGNTELKGLPMYITVLEGFIGWFLLSFFSLSLISQLIN